MSTAQEVKQALEQLADPEKAAFYPRFFKTGKGQYGEGDRFLGVTVPRQRKVARQFRGLPGAEVKKLLADPIHECRLTALLILVDQFQRGDDPTRKTVVKLYLDHLDRVNNWDLVDSSAHKILGAYLENRERGLLFRLARSGHLWRERVAMISCLHFIKQDDFDDALSIAGILLNHPHDLIHKAVGWMLREIGKQDRGTLENFLAGRYPKMPRTMLRYALEKFEPERRKAYLRGEV